MTGNLNMNDNNNNININIPIPDGAINQQQSIHRHSFSSHRRTSSNEW